CASLTTFFCAKEADAATHSATVNNTRFICDSDLRLIFLFV
ncbi:hypothetical protein PRABACTJOHN_01390, partial [Parabacteroides johnsonii DSM 18315]